METPFINYIIEYGLNINHEIDFKSLELPGGKIPPDTYGWDLPILDEDGKVTAECREALTEHAKAVSARTGIVLSVVYSDHECVYVEPDGSVLPSDLVPCLMATVNGIEERYELIGLPETVRNPGTAPEVQQAWVNKMKFLQFASVRAIREDGGLQEKEI